MPTICQVVIYDQLISYKILENDGGADTKGGTLRTWSGDILEAESGSCLEAEPNEESRDDVMSQATTSSANKHLSFKSVE